MRGLSLELQASIIKHLGVHDIFHLQQTCKSLNTLIEGNVEVWKACLKRHCHVEGLFWSSFNGLTKASEYKNACTGIQRFKRLCRTAKLSQIGKRRHLPAKVSGNPADESDSTGDEGSYALKNPYPGINSAYLVPGGRFLVTVEQAWLLLWDLLPLGKVGEPVVLLREKLDCNKDVKILDVLPLDGGRLRLVLNEPLPDGFPPSYNVDPSQYASRNDTKMLALHRFEIRLPENGDYTVQKLGRLCIAYLGYDDSQVAQGEHSIAVDISGCLLFWGSNDSGEEYTFWASYEDVDRSSIFMHQGYLFLVTRSSLGAINLSKLPRNPVKGGIVDIQCSYRLRAPAKVEDVVTCEIDTELPEGDFGMGQILLPNPVPKAGTVKYDMELHHWGGEVAYKLYRMTFDFRPDAPAKSDLRLFGVLEDYDWCDDYISPRNRFECGGGDFGYIWEKTDGLQVVSVSIYGGDDKKFKPVEIGVPENESVEIEDSDVLFCPFSGRAVILWDRTLTEEKLIEIVDFL